jgi:DNA primase
MTARDAQLLSFAVRCPDYLEALAGEGVAAGLESRAAREFFAKLAGGGPDELATRLDAAEAAFWTRAQLEPALDPEEAAAVFEEIRFFLHEARENDRRRSLMEAIRRAQERGAHDEALRLLGELQALSGRGDDNLKKSSKSRASLSKASRKASSPLTNSTGPCIPCQHPGSSKRSLPSSSSST